MASIERAIYDCLVKEFPGAIKNLTALSYNDAGKMNFIVSPELGFDYDQVNNFSGAYSTFHKEKSPDALYCVNDVLYFVEFKAGGHNKADIRLKIHEGIVTLFMFAKKYLPHITKEQFLKLKICYAVIVGADADVSKFQTALKQASEKYQLRNLDGFLLRRTTFTMCPNAIIKILNGLTGGKVKALDVYDLSKNLTRVTI